MVFSEVMYQYFLPVLPTFTPVELYMSASVLTVMTSNSVAKGSVRVQSSLTRHMPAVSTQMLPPPPQNLQKLCKQLKCLGSWRIKHLTQKSTSYLTLLLTLCKIHKNLKVFIHCTESSSDLCKQVYRVAFAYMSMSSLKCICVIQMCAVDTVSAL